MRRQQRGDDDMKERWRKEGLPEAAEGWRSPWKKWRTESLTEENSKTTWKVERRQTIDEIGDISCLCDWWRGGKRKRFVGRREKRRRAEVENGGSKEEDVDESMQGTEEKRGERDGRIHVIENGWGYSVTAVTVSVFHYSWGGWVRLRFPWALIHVQWVLYFISRVPTSPKWKNFTLKCCMFMFYIDWEMFYFTGSPLYTASSILKAN